MVDDEQKEKSTKNYFHAQKLIFKFLGLSLSPKRSTLYKTYSSFIVILMVTYPIFALPSHFKRHGNINELANSLLCCMGFIVATTKQVIIFTKRSELNTILETLENGAFLSNFRYRDDTETAWIKDCVKFMTRQTVVFVSFQVFTILAMVLSYVSQKDKSNDSTPFGTVVILTEYFKYETVYFYQSFVMLIAGIEFMTIDLTYAAIMAHICVQYRILKRFIKKIITISYNKEKHFECSNGKSTQIDILGDVRLQWEHLKQMLENINLFHLAIIDVADQAEKIFNIPVLVEFTLLSISYCCIMYELSEYSSFDIYFVRNVSMLIASGFPLLMLSYWGNEVLNQSRALAAACYEVDFHGTDTRFQKGLMLVMLRSQKPVTMTLGKFADLSLATMVSFCRAYFSYYMVLRNISNQ